MKRGKFFKENGKYNLSLFTIYFIIFEEVIFGKKLRFAERRTKSHNFMNIHIFLRYTSVKYIAMMINKIKSMK